MKMVIAETNFQLLGFGLGQSILATFPARHEVRAHPEEGPGHGAAEGSDVQRLLGELQAAEEADQEHLPRQGRRVQRF